VFIDSIFFFLAFFRFQGEKLNWHGEVFIQKHSDLRTKLVDGSSLAVAVVLHSIPKGTSQVLIRGNLNKLAYAIAHALCARGIQVLSPLFLYQIILVLFYTFLYYWVALLPLYD